MVVVSQLQGDEVVGVAVVVVQSRFGVPMSLTH